MRAIGHVEVEDALRDALVDVLGCDEQGEHHREPEEGSGRERERWEVIP